jgi:ribonuclease HI
MTSPRRSHRPAGHGRLFAEPESHGARAADASTAYVDGASRGNPGPAAYAVILQGPDGKTILELGKYLGRATNNVAEYYGLISALDAAASHGITRLRIRSDSELLVRQMEGRYRVKSPDLRPLYERAAKLARGFAYFAIEHVPREQNRDADRLANRALDRTAAGGEGEIRKPKSETRPENLPENLKEKLMRRIRARVAGGALVPEEPLSLADGTEVEVLIRKIGDG